MNVMKFFSTLLLTLAMLAPASVAARTPMDVFVDAPDAVLAFVPVQKRLDLRDYYTHSQATGVAMPDILPRISAADNNHVSIALGRRSSMDICLVPMGKDTVIAVIERVAVPAADATVMFYGSDWQPLIRQPGQISPDMFGASSGLPMFFADLRYDPETGVFKALNTTKSYYNPSDMPDIVKNMTDSVSLRFDGKKWRKVKP